MYCHDILSWSEGVADNLKNCHELLKRVRSDIEDTYHISIPVKYDDNPGFMMDFPILSALMRLSKPADLPISRIFNTDMRA